MAQLYNSYINKTKKILPPLLISLSLVACSSGSNDSSIPESDILSGKLVDLMIEGLSYQTASQSGKTNSQGNFSYKAGETVSFFIGDIAIGEAMANPEVTTFELVGISDPSTVTFGITQNLRERKYDEYSRADEGASEIQSRKVYEFDKLSNLIVLLTAIDEDGTFENGVRIPEKLNELTLNKTLGISEKSIFDFKSQFINSNLLNDAVNSGIWAKAPELIDPMDALDNFYLMIGQPSKLPVNTKVLTDSNNDGVVESYTETKFNEMGNISGYYKDNDNDGVLDSAVEIDFDHNGNVTTWKSDNNGDGVFESYTSSNYSYYEDGVKSSESSVSEYDSDNDGVRETVVKQTREYDTDGRVTLHDSDEKPGTIFYFTKTYTYTDNIGGYIEKVDTDADRDGDVDVTKELHYDKNDRLIFSEFDPSQNSSSIAYQSDNSTVTYQYDSNGNLTYHEQDTNADGTPEVALTKTYDAYGNLAEEVYSRSDYDRVQSWEREYDSKGNTLTLKYVDLYSPDNNYFQTSAYDSKNRVIATTTDKNIDGSIDSSTEVVFHGDSFGSQTVKTLDESGVTTSVSSTLFDDRGNLIERSIDTDHDGTANEGNFYTYNDNDWIIEEIALDERGVLANDGYRTSYQYDGQGNQASVTVSPVDGSSSGSNTIYEYIQTLSWKQLYELVGGT